MSATGSRPVRFSCVRSASPLHLFVCAFYRLDLSAHVNCTSTTKPLGELASEGFAGRNMGLSGKAGRSTTGLKKRQARQYSATASWRGDCQAERKTRHRRVENSHGTTKKGTKQNTTQYPLSSSCSASASCASRPHQLRSPFPAVAVLMALLPSSHLSSSSFWLVVVEALDTVPGLPFFGCAWLFFALCPSVPQPLDLHDFLHSFDVLTHCLFHCHWAVLSHSCRRRPTFFSPLTLLLFASLLLFSFLLLAPFFTFTLPEFVIPLLYHFWLLSPSCSHSTSCFRISVQFLAAVYCRSLALAVASCILYFDWLPFFFFAPQFLWLLCLSHVLKHIVVQITQLFFDHVLWRCPLFVLDGDLSSLGCWLGICTEAIIAPCSQLFTTAHCHSTYECLVRCCTFS